MTESPQAHREYLELLPWYVNGALAERERGLLEAHLRECLPCNAALRDERRLSSALRDQDAVPLGPEHGLNALFNRIDRGQRQGRTAARFVPWIGYGVAAALGGGIVWLWLAMAPLADPAGAEFATLATPAEGGGLRIDILFASPPSAEALAAFRAEIGAARVTGPSEIGRYTFALEGGTEAGIEARTEAGIDSLIATLRRDPRIRFAGRSYAAASDGGTATESAGEDR